MTRAHAWAIAFLLSVAGAGAAEAAETATVVATALEKATQALADAVAPGQRTVWEQYTDPDFVYVTEDNEVKSRNTMLAELQPLPPGYTGSLKVEEFRCSSFGTFAVTTYILDEHETIEGHALHARYRSSDTWRATEGGWRLVATQVYAVQQDPERTTLSAGRLAEYAGWYALSASTREEITRDGDHLVAQRSGRAPQVLLPESGDVFFTPGRPRTRRIFTRDADGRVNGFADRREGTDLAWTRLAAPAPGR
ncbi:MAG TPA: DUF4440 domain-containing protein [Steroidobacteraceae bacterium]|nr:DUF4440 domain-containing protein [Steroidobacteraceae bacterium]